MATVFSVESDRPKTFFCLTGVDHPVFASPVTAETASPKQFFEQGMRMVERGVLQWFLFKRVDETDKKYALDQDTEITNLPKILKCRIAN